MVNAYFDRKIKKQNQFIYLKNGRWIVVLIMSLSALLIAESRLSSNEISDGILFGNIKGTVIAALPYFITYLLMILYIVPYYFKRNFYKKFWIAIAVLILICAFTELLIHNYLEMQGWMEAYPESKLQLFANCILNQIGNLLGLTGVLYIFEIFEEVILSKETILNLKVWKESERKMKGTKTDFPYMLQSLRGINSKLKGDGSINATTSASESMLLFAAILRYKLYGYDQIYVPVTEELEVVSNLVKFYNSVLESESNNCDIEIVGNAEEWMIEKQLLVNILYPFLKNSESPFFSNIICFVEMESGIMNLTIQADYHIQVEMEQILEKVKDSVSKNTEITNFETQIENSYIILNLCLTLTKK